HGPDRQPQARPLRDQLLDGLSGPEGERQVQLGRAAMGQQSNDRRGLIAFQSCFTGPSAGPRGEAGDAAGIESDEPVVDRGPGDAEQTGSDSRLHGVAHDRANDPSPQVVLSFIREAASVERTNTLSTLRAPKAPSIFCSP